MGSRKRKQLLSDEMLQDVWGINPMSYQDGELGELGNLVASAVSRCLLEDKDSRPEIAELMSSMLGEDISVHMLNAYSSPARKEHGINAHRFLALIAITRRYDILDAILRQIGAKALDHLESQVFEVGRAAVHRESADRSFRELMGKLIGRIDD